MPALKDVFPRNYQHEPIIGYVETHTHNTQLSTVTTVGTPRESYKMVIDIILLKPH